jgi:hypothetical protein
MTKDEVLSRLETLHEGSYTRKVIDKLGERVMDELAEYIAANPDFNVKTFFDTHKQLQEFEVLEQQLHKMAENRVSGEINGQMIDGFSAYMVSSVLNKLTYEQKKALLKRPTNEIVAIAYKLASRTEF